MASRGQTGSTVAPGGSGALLVAGIGGAAVLGLGWWLATGSGLGFADFAVLGTAASAFGIALVAQLQVRRLQRESAKTASDLDHVSARLITLEGRLLEVARAALPGGAVGGLNEEDREGIDAAFGEVNAEIGILSELLRDLALASAAQDREVAELKAAAAAAAIPAPGPAAPSPASPLPLVARRADAPARLPTPAPAAPAAVPPPVVVAPRPEERPARRLAAVDDTRSRAVLRALSADGLELHLQPIVSLPHRRVRSYEALARLKLDDGTVLVPAEFLPVVEAARLTALLDSIVLDRAAAIARHLVARGSEATLGLNLALSSLLAPDLFRTAMRLAEGDPDLPARLVFELSQSTWRNLDVAAAAALTALRTKGFGFALDRATDLRIDALMLADRGVRYAKLPAALLLEPGASAGLDIDMSDLAFMLQRAGIALVADKVEREDQVPDLIELDVPLAQGFVFAAPRAVRTDPAELAARGREAQPLPLAETALAEEKAADQAPERRPFRAFLRRAG